MPKPKLNPAVGLSPVTGGYLAYNSTADVLHELNAMGALLVELCDGSREIEDISELASPFLPAGQSGEVEHWIGKGIAAGLLIWGDGDAVPSRSLSATELADLAANLRRTSRYETAYLCLQRLTDLEPNDSDAWWHLGKAAQSTGRRAEAANAYEKYLGYVNEDASIRHLVTALKDEPPPPRASNECILQTFKSFAPEYDSKMREALSYQAPERLQEMIQSAIGDVSNLGIVDLGCGTGLAGAALKEHAGRLVGIDLSPEMLELAQGRGVYDSLETAEIIEWLTQTEERFDLIVACDSLVYFGDLLPVVAAAAARLRRGGLLAFTTEKGEREPFHLSDSGRYTHHPNHLYQVAAATGQKVVTLEDGFLRTEGGNAVTGLLALLMNPCG